MSSPTTPAKIEIFCCYAREDQELLQRLKKHLMPLQRQGLITIWSDTNINAGAEWEKEINKHLDTAHIVLLLVSSDFMASEYCYSKEMKRAMQRHEQGDARVIPIILRTTFWKGAPFEKLQALPTDARAVRSWPDPDDAFFNVAEHISTVVKELRIQHSLAEARKLYAEQHYEEALVIYDQLILLESAYAPAHVGKGEALLALERYEESLAASDEARQADSSVADAHFYHSRASALRKLQRCEESLAAYDEAMRLDPRVTHFYAEKAEVLLHLQRYQEALETYEQLMRLEPNQAVYYQRKGDLLLRLGRSAQALEAYEQAIRLDPQAQSYDKKGEILLNLKKYEDALVTYEQAIRLEPREAQYHQKKGMALLSLERYEDALAAYEDCVKLGPDENPYYYYGTGQALFGLERYEEALAAYEQAIRLAAPDPDPQFYHDEGVVYERLAQQAYESEKQARLDWKPKGSNALPIIVVVRPEAFTLLRTLSGHGNAVESVAFSPDGQTLASGSADQTIKLWNVQTGQVLRTLSGHTNYVYGGLHSVPMGRPSPVGVVIARSNCGTCKRGKPCAPSAAIRTTFMGSCLQSRWADACQWE